MGKQVYIVAGEALRNDTNIEVLVVVGTIASYVYFISTFLYYAITRFWSPTYLEASAMLITFVLVSKYLKCLATGNTFDAIKKLVELAPPTTLWVVIEKGGRAVEEKEIDSLLSQKFAADVSDSQDAKTQAESGECQDIISMGLGTNLWDPGGDDYTANILSSFFKIWDRGGTISSAVLFWLSTPSP